MKRQYIFLLITLLCKISLFAQDSIQRFTVYNNRFFESLADKGIEEAFNIANVPVENYTASSFSYSFEDGALKQGGEPEAITSMGLKTTGIYKSENGTVFFGRFSIDKSYYSNLKWNLSYNNPHRGRMADPHYFAVSKGSKWSNQEYNVQGGALFPLSKRFKLLAKADYTLFNKYRTEYDPKPEITYNELILNAGLEYTLKPKNHFKFGGKFGYADVNNSITYINSNVAYPANYDIYIKWIAGYGTMTSPFKNNLEKDISEYGFYAGYSFTGNKVIWNTAIKYSNKAYRTYRNFDVNDKEDRSNYFADFNTDRIDVNASAIYFYSRNNLFKFNLAYRELEGENYWFTKAGKTYSASEQEFSLDVSFLKLKNQFTNWDVNTSLGVYTIEQIDALAQTTSRYTNMEAGLSIQKSILQGRTITILPFITMSGRFNMDSYFINGNKDYLENILETDYAGLTQKTFYEEVVYPDYALYSSNSLYTSLGTNVGFKLSEKLDGMIVAKGGIEHLITQTTYFNEAEANRYNLLLTFKVFY